MLLDKIQFPQDLKKLSLSELSTLAAEMRDFILDVVSTKEGHLGASLGVVDLTIALHYFYDTPHDLLLWDVGHQAYGHKLLTGRKNDFETLRQLGGMSGFPVREESEYDAFGVGHSSTTISAITGMALADKIKNIHRNRIAVIGDASIVSGMALEGLNHLGATDLDVTIILNDNNIGIDYSVGALKKHFGELGENTHSGFFEALGFTYKGVIDGHNIEELLTAFQELKEIKTPKLLHIKTIKGKGFSQAEQNQVLWHSPGKFNKISGERFLTKQRKTYPEIVGETLGNLLQNNADVVVITPAMLTGSGLINLQEKFPDRVLDVGIAEQHAVTLSAGLSTQGMIPFCVIYSTFLQRAYDQVIHDVALQSLPVVFCIDRAGIVGTDGATHHGYFDISFMNSIPNMIVACPLEQTELQQMLHLAVQLKQPISIRYPKSEVSTCDLKMEKVKCFQAKVMQKGTKMAVLTTGTIGLDVLDIIKGNSEIAWVHFPFVKPLDTTTLKTIFAKFNQIVTIEEGIQNGGFGESILAYASAQNYKGKIKIKALPDAFIPHGTTQELLAINGLDKNSIAEAIFSV
ncbi:1-deoxy-D-xylulose-5-phosphate synthase [Weeksellaceae bacterium TAE3-ERU29]|nr:1-deoxy-D-xylulose-5-phosphate synthase [Weeksellaceae bacterium TAE3-ERU29]